MARLLTIGLAGLDWAGFEAACVSGAIPAMAALRARGWAGWLGGAPLDGGPAAWASLATGLQPEQHGVWRTQESWPGGLRPIGRASWRAAPLWTRLEAAGIRTGVVAWPGSRPGADWGGLVVDDSFAEASGATAQAWALPRRCVPEQLRETLRPRRVHPTQITATMLRPLVPALETIAQSHDADLPRLAVGLAAGATTQSAAAWMLTEVEPAPEAVFIHHAALGAARAAFEDRPAPFDGVAAGAWRFVDALVGRLAALAGPETLLLVVSPGWRGAPGVMLAAGPGVSAGADAVGASLLDLAPSIFAAFGLGDDRLPGRPLPWVVPAQALASAPAPELAKSEKSDARLVWSLRKFGYRPPPRAPRAWEAQGLADLALMALERDPAVAGRIADQALLRDRDCVLALRVRVRAHIALGEIDPLPALADQLIAVAPDRGWGPLARGAYHVLRKETQLATPWLRRAEADEDVGTLLTAAAVWIGARRLGAAERVFQGVLAREPDNVSARIGLAMALTARRQFLEAESHLTRAMRREPGRPAIHLQLAQVLARSGRKAEARVAADRAVRLGAAPAHAAAAGAGRLPA
jgi:tetratricopeptide (TPR) repeat protein